MASVVDTITAKAKELIAKTNENEVITADLSNKGLIPKKATKAKLILSDQDSSGTEGTTFHGFILESVGISMNCKYQLTETFTTGFFTAFGKRPTFLNIAGTLLDSENYPWFDNMIVNYRDLLNASDVVANERTLRLMYDNKIMEVLMLSLSLSQGSQSVLQGKFQSQLLLVGDIKFLGE